MGRKFLVHVVTTFFSSSESHLTNKSSANRMALSGTLAQPLGSPLLSLGGSHMPSSFEALLTQVEAALTEDMQRYEAQLQQERQARLRAEEEKQLLQRQLALLRHHEGEYLGAMDKANKVSAACGALCPFLSCKQGHCGVNKGVYFHFHLTLSLMASGMGQGSMKVHVSGGGRLIPHAPFPTLSLPAGSSQQCPTGH